MFITGLGTANPPNQYTQKECWETLIPSQTFARLKPRSRTILEKVLLGDNGIESRYLALDHLEEAFQLDPDTLHRRFFQRAPQLATSAAREALANAAISSEQIDAVIISTCTGYLCPGLTSYVSERLGLRADALPLDLVGQGCGAAIPNLRTGEALIRSGRCKQVLSICVEVSSAALFLDDDPGVLISACLFGDGAAAAVLSDAPRAGQRKIEWLAAETHLSAEDRDYLRFDHCRGMLKNILSMKVPSVAAKHAETVLTKLLKISGTDRGDIASWIFHAGGKNVLQALRERLLLSGEQVRLSSEILKTHGNMSSPFVLFVLKAALEREAHPGRWYLSSFGAGFSCHGAMIQVSQ